MPSARNPDFGATLVAGQAMCASRCSLRMRVIKRRNIAMAPALQMVARMTAVRPSVISQMGPPIAARGYAQVKCAPQSLSISAPEGTKKLNAVATQIQYLVVALARSVEVSAHAAAATMEANSR